MVDRSIAMLVHQRVTWPWFHDSFMNISDIFPWWTGARISRRVLKTVEPLKAATGMPAAALLAAFDEFDIQWAYIQKE